MDKGKASLVHISHFLKTFLKLISRFPKVFGLTLLGMGIMASFISEGRH